MAIEHVAIAVLVDIVDLIADAVVFGVPTIEPGGTGYFDRLADRKLEKKQSVARRNRAASVVVAAVLLGLRYGLESRRCEKYAKGQKKGEG